MRKSRPILLGLLSLIFLITIRASYGAVNCQQYPANEVAICNTINSQIEEAKQKFKNYFSSVSPDSVKLLNQTTQSSQNSVTESEQPQADSLTQPQQTTNNNSPLQPSGAAEKNSVHISYE